MGATDERPVGERRLNRVTVRIGGVECALRGEEPAAYLHQLAQRVNAQMEEATAANPRLTQAQAAMLVALRATDELNRLKEQHQRVLTLVERQWGQRRDPAGPASRAEGGA